MYYDCLAELGSSIYNLFYIICEFIDCQLDVLYLKWVLSKMYPALLVIFILPFSILFLLYVSALIFYIHTYRWSRVREVLNESLADPMVAGRYLISMIWDVHGYIWFGYEVKGAEHIPKEGGALIIYYHGAIPIDVYYLVAHTIARGGRHIHCVGDRFLKKIPGWQTILDAFKVSPATVEDCVRTVTEGNLLAISPGGVREAQFSDHSYPVLWGSRRGFAKVAQQTNCPIIPMFTRNTREAFRVLTYPLSLFEALYSRFKLPFAPIYGGFPVKLVTYLGPCIYPKAEESVDELALRVEEAVYALIDTHQRLPGNILAALFDRIHPCLGRKIMGKGRGRADKWKKRKVSKQTTVVKDKPRKEETFPLVENTDAFMKENTASIIESATAIKESATTIKESATTIIKNSDSIKETSDSIKETSDSIKETSDSIKETSDSIKETSDSIKETSESLKETSEFIRETAGSKVETSDFLKQIATSINETAAPVEEAPVTVEEAPDTMKEAPDTVKEAPDTVKEAPDTVKEAPDTVKEAPDTVKEAPDTVKEAPDTVKEAPDTVKDAAAPVKEASAHLKESSAYLKESSAHLKEGSAHLKGSSAHLKGSSAHLKGSSAHLKGSSAHLEESSAHLEESSAHLEESSAHLEESSAHLEESSAHLKGSSAHLKGSSAHLEESSTHLEESSTHLKESSALLAETTASIKDKIVTTEDDKLKESESSTEIEASNPVILQS